MVLVIPLLALFTTFMKLVSLKIFGLKSLTNWRIELFLLSLLWEFLARLEGIPTRQQPLPSIKEVLPMANENFGIPKGQGGTQHYILQTRLTVESLWISAWLLNQNNEILFQAAFLSSVNSCRLRMETAWRWLLCAIEHGFSWTSVIGLLEKTYNSKYIAGGWWGSLFHLVGRVAVRCSIGKDGSAQSEVRHKIFYQHCYWTMLRKIRT